MSRLGKRSRSAWQLMAVGCLSALVPFVACRTEDPRPGVETEDRARAGTGNGGRGGSRSTPPQGGDTNPVEGGAGGADSGAVVVGRECGDAPSATSEFTKQALLDSAGQCSAYYTCLFSNAIAELALRVSSYVAEPTEDGLEQARSAWTSATEVWSTLVPLQYGPMASVAVDSYQGRGIGAFIHAWPASNRCETEKQIASRLYESQGFQRVLPGARGLPAIEYVLFYEGSDTVCASNSSTAKTWASIGADDLEQAKRDYAQALVDDLSLKAEELFAVWASDGENFGATLAEAEGYGSEQEALNVVATSLLYVYSEVRDLKVAPLAGVGTTLPNPMSPYARIDLPSIQANLRSFRALFEGCGPEGAGIGVDDWLLAAGAEELSQDISQALADAEAQAGELPPLHEASPQELATFHATLKVLTDLLKEELFGSGSVLNLKLPASAASDTD